MKSLIDRHDEDQFSLIPAATFMKWDQIRLYRDQESIRCLFIQVEIRCSNIDTYLKVSCLAMKWLLMSLILMGRYEVTQAQWYDVMGENPSNIARE